MKVKQFILDTSITMSWLFEDEYDPYADKALDSLAFSTCMVPAIWPLEVSNVLVVAERRKRITEGDSLRFMSLLETLPIEVTGFIYSVRNTREILSLARDFKLSSYDASYLNLAITQGLPLATLDNALQKAAKKANVPIHSF